MFAYVSLRSKVLVLGGDGRCDHVVQLDASCGVSTQEQVLEIHPPTRTNYHPALDPRLVAAPPRPP